MQRHAVTVWRRRGDLQHWATVNKHQNFPNWVKTLIIFSDVGFCTIVLLWKSGCRFVYFNLTAIKNFMIGERAITELSKVYQNQPMEIKGLLMLPNHGIWKGLADNLWANVSKRGWLKEKWKLQIKWMDVGAQSFSLVSINCLKCFRQNFLLRQVWMNK